MSYLDSIATVQTPVSAIGLNILNRHCDVVARCENSFMASAIADLINKGTPAAEEEGLRHAEREEPVSALIAAGLQPR